MSLYTLLLVKEIVKDARKLIRCLKPLGSYLWRIERYICEENKQGFDSLSCT